MHLANFNENDEQIQKNVTESMSLYLSLLQCTCGWMDGYVKLF